MIETTLPLERVFPADGPGALTSGFGTIFGFFPKRAPSIEKFTELVGR